jgi:hypothetical protein
MLTLVGTVMSRPPSGNVLLSGGDGVLGTHKVDVSAKQQYEIERVLAAIQGGRP